MGPSPHLIWGEMAGRSHWLNRGAEARQATSAPANFELPRWHDVEPEDIGFLRARIARLQENIAAVQGGIMMLYGQRHWVPHASATLRHLVNHGFPELEDIHTDMYICKVKLVSLYDIIKYWLYIYIYIYIYIIKSYVCLYCALLFVFPRRGQPSSRMLPGPSAPTVTSPLACRRHHQSPDSARRTFRSTATTRRTIVDKFVDNLAALVESRRVQRTQVKLNLMRGKQVKLNTPQRTHVETHFRLEVHWSATGAH